MAIRVGIEHPLPPGHENAKPVVVYIEEPTPETSERWFVNIDNRDPAPVMELLRSHDVVFLFDDTDHLFVGTQPLPAAVIVGLVRLPYTFRA